MKKAIVTALTIALLSTGVSANASPILDTTDVNELYNVKTINVTVGSKEADAIKKAIDNYSISVECIIGVTKTATVSQRKAVSSKAATTCKNAKAYATSIDNHLLSVKTKVVQTTKSQANKVSLKVSYKDVVAGYPYLKKGYLINSSALALGSSWNITARVEYPVFGGADWRTITSAGDLVIHQYAYLCDKPIKDRSKYENMTFNQVGQAWESECLKSLDIVSGVPFSLRFQGDRYIRLVARGSNNFGGLKLIDEIAYSSNRP